MTGQIRALWQDSVTPPLVTKKPLFVRIWLPIKEMCHFQDKEREKKKTLLNLLGPVQILKLTHNPPVIWCQEGGW